MNIVFNFTFYYVISFLLVLGVLVFCHELGHFLLAKAFKVKVLKFALGFGSTKIISKQIGETEYSIRWIPLGGFVKLLGEDDDEETKNLPPEELARALDHQTVPKKICILAAGSLFNIFLAVFIFIGIFFFKGEGIYHIHLDEVKSDGPFQAIGVQPGSDIIPGPAKVAGLRPGDVIMAFDGQLIKSPGGLQEYLLFKAGVPIDFEILRAKMSGEEKVLHILVTPREETRKIQGQEFRTGYINVASYPELVAEIPLGPFDSVIRGIQQTYEEITKIFNVLGLLFTGRLSIKALGGPIMISKITGDVAKMSFWYLIPLLAVISVNLGILNLFPVPILDGSMIVLVLIEAVIGKPLSTKQKEWIFKIGLAIIIGFALFVAYNDIFRLILG
jgi:regulator of sigma E protease